MALVIDNLRRVDETLDSLAPKTKRQVTLLLKSQDGQTLAKALKNEESILHGMEVLDVVRGKRVLYQIFLWGGDNGQMLEGTTIVASISQGDFVLHGDDLALNEAVKAAWADARGRLHPRNTFTVGTPVPPAPPQPADLTAKLEALRARLAAVKDPYTDDKWLFANTIEVVREVMGPYRPIPVKRPFELTAIQRAVLTFLADSPFQEDLSSRGLPHHYDKGANNSLRRILGMAPPSARDAEVTLDSKPHPVWTLVSDVAHRLRPAADVLDAICGQLSPALARAALHELLAPGEDTGQRRYLCPDEKLFLSGPSLKQELDELQPVISRYVELLVAWAVRLDDRLEGAPDGEFAMLVSLSAAVARDGTLDATADERLAALLAAPRGDDRAWREPMVRLLAALPAERAAQLIAQARAPWYAELLAAPTSKKRSNAWYT